MATDRKHKAGRPLDPDSIGTRAALSKVEGRNLLGSHQKCWLWGRNVVLETLRAGAWPVLEELHVAGTLAAAAAAVVFYEARRQRSEGR
jgi:hypothetical protein